ncbi:hypothetical protein LC040_03265 [Bacillus tianshenii]|nr:hypothetical protein LC040_03265 [Bacillus tianshenii]
MNSILRWVFAIFLVMLAIAMLNKGIDLWALGTDVDGDGIGVHFMGLEINDTVPEHLIPKYATGFFIASAVSVVAAFLVIKFSRS